MKYRVHERQKCKHCFVHLFPPESQIYRLKLNRNKCLDLKHFAWRLYLISDLNVVILNYSLLQRFNLTLSPFSTQALVLVRMPHLTFALWVTPALTHLFFWTWFFFAFLFTLVDSSWKNCQLQFFAFTESCLHLFSSSRLDSLSSSWAGHEDREDEDEGFRRERLPGCLRFLFSALMLNLSGFKAAKRNHRGTIWLRRDLWLRLGPLRDLVSSFSWSRVDGKRVFPVPWQTFGAKRRRGL